MATSLHSSLAVQAQPPCYQTMGTTKKIQYMCAVILIMSSVTMVAFQVFTIQDVANGLLIYVAQAFLLVGSIFGLDYYVDRIADRRIYKSLQPK